MSSAKKLFENIDAYMIGKPKSLDHEVILAFMATLTYNKECYAIATYKDGVITPLKDRIEYDNNLYHKEGFANNIRPMTFVEKYKYNKEAKKVDSPYLIKYESRQDKIKSALWL